MKTILIFVLSLVYPLICMAESPLTPVGLFCDQTKQNSALTHDPRARQYIEITIPSTDEKPEVIAVFDLLSSTHILNKDVEANGSSLRFVFFDPKQHSSFTATFRATSSAMGVCLTVTWTSVSSKSRTDREFEKEFPLDGRSFESIAAGIPYIFRLVSIK